MSRIFPLFSFICFFAFVPGTSIAQEAIYQRAFPVAGSDISAAVQKTAATLKGRLPTLEGFVQQPDQPLERFDKGYYECTFQVSPSIGGATTVRAQAKITAWFSDPNGANSGYRILRSNGRLESDALDRIAETLSLPPASATNLKLALPSISAPPFEGNSHYSGQGGVRSSGSGTSSGSWPYGVSSGAASDESAVSSTLPGNLRSDHAILAAHDKKSEELSNYIHNLEEIQRNQSHPTDLAAVNKPKTPIFAKPSETAHVLMNADVQDEFQVLGVDGTWVHVQISGASRGWIRRNQLEMPLGFSVTEGTSPQNPSANDVPFKLVKEETAPFRGSWQPLKGRSVRIEWIEPTNPAASTSRKDKLAYAKSTLLRASQGLSQSQQSVEGIVIVFDSADGGQIAAQLVSVKALSNHTLSEAAFWKECSIDPPESFLASTKQ